MLTSSANSFFFARQSEVPVLFESNNGLKLGTDSLPVRGESALRCSMAGKRYNEENSGNFFTEGSIFLPNRTRSSTLTPNSPNRSSTDIPVTETMTASRVVIAPPSSHFQRVEPHAQRAGGPIAVLVMEEEF